MAPFERSFAEAGVPLVPWRLGQYPLDLDAEPPAGVFWSRLSASAHTREAAIAKDAARSTLGWLESWGRRVVGGVDVADLEVSKVIQHGKLRRAGFDVPRTLAAFGPEQLRELSQDLPTPFITKHNQGGKGLGVQRFDTREEFLAHLDGPDFVDSADGVTLLQELLVAPEPFITRAEFVGGTFVYAVRVDTSKGAFQLCPADACQIPGDVPPVQRDETITAEDPLVQRYGTLLAELGIEIAGIEFLRTVDGRTVTYDINTNTNYNADVEASAPRRATDAVAEYLGGLLTR
jgi:hypothetical protein